jgi:hypothetical protein
MCRARIVSRAYQTLEIPTGAHRAGRLAAMPLRSDLQAFSGLPHQSKESEQTYTPAGAAPRPKPPAPSAVARTVHIFIHQRSSCPCCRSYTPKARRPCTRLANGKAPDR